MQTVIIVIHLMLVLALVGVVLLQKSEGGGLGMGGGGGGFMSSRGTANVLTRATAILAACSSSPAWLLSILAGMDRKPTSILRRHAQRAGRAGSPARRRRWAAAAAACSINCSGGSAASGAGGARRRRRAAGAAVEMRHARGAGKPALRVMAKQL